MKTRKTDAAVSRQRSRDCLKIVATVSPTNITRNFGTQVLLDDPTFPSLHRGKELGVEVYCYGDRSKIVSFLMSPSHKVPQRKVSCIANM
jgi:hypothetical protein